MADLPTGIVTFLFTDIEGSTRLAAALGDGYAGVLERHNAILREAIGTSEGRELATQGDSFFSVFTEPTKAVEAAVHGQRALGASSWPAGASVRVRMGMHTGEARLGGDNYVGLSVHRAARIADAAHGGQVLLSETTTGEVRAALPDNVRLRELGEHWLRDLEHPEQLSQLLVEGLQTEFPPLRATRRPVNLPVELTSFVERDEDSRRVESGLAEGRLVTLVGSGGTGKTRLALHVAAGVAGAYPGGVAFVPLEGVFDVERIPGAVAEALGLRQDAAASTVELLSNHLRDRRALLVLDNLEQLPEAGATLVRLLREAPLMTILATSRGSLHVEGERTVRVPPLPVPDLGRLARVDELRKVASVALFEERAGNADPSFTLTDANASAVAALCARLDGLPLAIELAAARIPILTPQAMLDRLDRPLALLGAIGRGGPERQRTLRRTIAWSHELLTGAEQSLFRRLAVFAGGWTIEAAEAVVPDADVLDGLESLVDKSLVRRHDRAGEPHFEMLSTIREFALEQLADDAAIEAETRRRHAAYWLARAEALAPDLERGTDAALRLLDEQDNLRAALRYALGTDAGDSAEAADIGLRLAIALGRFWTLNAAREGTAWLERAIAVASGADLLTQGELYFWSGVLLDEQFRGDEAERCLNEALTRFRELDDEHWQARVLNSLGVVARSKGELARARELLSRSLALRQSIGPEERLAAVLSNLGVVAADEGRLDEAQGHLEASLEIDRRMDNLDGIATGVGNLGGVALRMGRLDDGERLIAESLRLFARVGDVLGITDDLEHAAEAAAQRGRHEQAARLLGAVETIRRSEGLRMPKVDLSRYRGIADGVRDALGSEAYAAAYNSGCSLTRDAAVEEAIAGLDAAQG
jgi:predicted ATPase/class 3 adenylate cyclase